MAQASSQIQLHRDIKSMITRIDKLETKIKIVLKKIDGKRDIKLEKGLRELKEGKGKLYKSLEEWEKDIKS